MALEEIATSDGTQADSTRYTNANISQFLLSKIWDRGITRRVSSKLLEIVLLETFLWRDSCALKIKLVTCKRDNLRWQENYQSQNDSTNSLTLLLMLSTSLSKPTKFQREYTKGSRICFRSCAESNRCEVEARWRASPQVTQKRVGPPMSDGFQLYSAVAKKVFKNNLPHTVLLKINELIVTFILSVLDLAWVP